MIISFDLPLKSPLCQSQCPPWIWCKGNIHKNIVTIVSSHDQPLKKTRGISCQLRFARPVEKIFVTVVNRGRIHIYSCCLHIDLKSGLFWENHQKHTIAIFVVEKHHLIVNELTRSSRGVSAQSPGSWGVVTVVPNADLRFSKLAMNETSPQFQCC